MSKASKIDGHDEVEDSKPSARTKATTSDDRSQKVHQQNRNESEKRPVPDSPTMSIEEKRQRREQDWIDGAFTKTTELLEDLPADGARFLAPMPSVVTLRNAVVPPPPLPMIFAPRRKRNIYSSGTSDIPSTVGTLGVENIISNNSNDNNNAAEEGDSSSVDAVSHGTGNLRGGLVFQQSNVREHNNSDLESNISNSNSSLLTPNRGHHALFRNLEDLEGFDKLESELQLRSPLTTSLTTIATGDDVCYQTPREAVNTLEALSRSVPRRVCQHPFKKNDIVWVCRTCQADETCVLCHACFKGSNHEGHDVAFYHAQAGGCCDCGDPDAWDPAGFCNKHGPFASVTSSSTCTIIGAENDDLPRLGPLSGSVVYRVQGIVPAAVDWMVKHVASAAEEGFVRTEEEKEEPGKQEEQVDRLQSRQPPPSQLQSSQLGSPQSSDGEDVEMKDSSDVISTTTSQAVSSFNCESPGKSKPLPAPVGRRRIFSPTAAGKSRRQEIAEKPLTKAEKLGILARQGGGLYLVLKSDDIHSDRQLIEAIHELFGTSSMYTESTLTKVVQALKQFGQLVVWGTTELLAELSTTQIQLWLDGDRIASGVLGAAMLRRAEILTRSHGLFCSILTRRELQVEQRAVNVLQWLTGLARSCDPLCQKVAESISPDRHLAPLLRADFKLSSRITKYWHSLLLTLLAVPTFKSHLAVAYCDTYQSVTAEYARGMGVLERSGYALSVQFLNRVTYVLDLVQRRDLLGKLGASLFQTLDVAAMPVDDENDTIDTGDTANALPTPSSVAIVGAATRQRRLNPVHFVMMNRRYSPCISDLKCVLNVKGMPRLFATKSGCFLKDWISALGLGQMMDSQIWRDYSQGHIELEHRGWVGAFNASISLGSLFERLLSWDDSDPSPIQDPNSPMSKNLMTCVELTFHVLTTGIYDWQNLAMSTYRPTPHTASLEAYKRRSASLPFSTISVKLGSVLAFRALPISQTTPFSFHLPLHRFVAACLREACLRKTGIQDLRALLSKNVSEEVQDKLFIGLMEFPLLVLSRAAQVRAGLWKRNGNGLNDQVLNYAEPPFCRAMRDADLLLIQFAMLGRIQNQTAEFRPDSDVGVCFLVHLLLHRLGLFDFCGLEKAPNANVNRYLDEVQKGFYSSEKDSGEIGQGLPMPSTYSPARETGSCLLLLEEFLHAIIIICKELPPEPPTDKAAHTAQAKSRLRREVIHRLASGPKTHSEMAEVHHVLSHWDNVYLSEEGKLLNPDDATGAALGVVLAEVANRKISRRTMEPDKWELNREAWESYDPSFYHINLRNHQTAAESRPAFPSDNKFRVKPKPFCQGLSASHPDFVRLRRDVTCDATILAITYRTLHMHIRDNKKRKESVELRGAMAYEGDDKSETAVARAVHVLTLGAYAWQDASAEDKNWRKSGGGSIGSVFFDRSDNDAAPTVKEWISAALLANPKLQQASDWYEGEENCLQLLRRLAVDGGFDGCFFAQDRAVQAGAAWLCEFAARHNSEASALVYLKESADCADDTEKQETELERRKRFAKQKAMERMKAQAAKFAFAMQDELVEKDEKDASMKSETNMDIAMSPAMSRQMSFASNHSRTSSLAGSDDAQSFASPDAFQGLFDEPLIPMRLLKNRPQCIICSDDSNAEKRAREREDLGHRQSRRRRTSGGNALAFVGYTQASTVMKGGGGLPTTGDTCTFVPVKRFVGAHVALCGHAIHSECWESYLATISRREDRRVSKKDEFRCPLCQRLSNCLIPFIDVGADWIDPALSTNNTTPLVKSDDKEDAMSCESMEAAGPSSSQKFLDSTPWWVSRHNDSVTWDGQCAFVSNKQDPTKIEQKPGLSPTPRRRSVRALRKKDLYAAWNAMMKTPRFVKRKLRPKADSRSGDSSDPQNAQEDLSIAPLTSTDSAAETVVWRRFMDQVSDITYKADGKRLGDENLHKDFGEFRHYIVEKYSYSLANKYVNKEPLDWPSCVFPTTLYETQRQELSREKLLSKLMMSIQSLTYSICCEVNEARRLTRIAKAKAAKYGGSALSSDDKSIKAIFSKYGISHILSDGRVVVLPRPNAIEDDGFQPFNGRLGRLRYFGLAVMATAGAVAADLVQLVIGFPLQSTENTLQEPYRAPIVYPILFGNVLTHVVAAICASAGRARARSDSLELVWPIPFCSRGSFISSKSTDMPKKTDSVVDDAEGFIKLGLLARVLQVLLGKLDLPDASPGGSILETVQKMRTVISAQDLSAESAWTMHCLSLLEMAFSKFQQPTVIQNISLSNEAIAERIQEGCLLAAQAACSFLEDIGIILQLLVPGIMARYTDLENIEDRGKDNDDTYATLSELHRLFRLEPLSEILESDAIREVVSNWYETAQNHSRAKTLKSPIVSRTGAMVSSRLFKTQGFRVYDWPMESCRDTADRNQVEKKNREQDLSLLKDKSEGTPMDVDSPVETDVLQTNPTARPPPQTHLVSFSPKKNVSLIGGYTPDESPILNSNRPRISMMPTSYTDLYAELSHLLPDSEQTAVCLVCGEVLNAGGRGECTKHSYKCGAGAGMFFLLQECAGLIMHNAKAAYIHSPYVDSHGETPQYRGRPLNLDLDRYGHLKEVWSGHNIRQQVLAERESSRQIIVDGFY